MRKKYILISIILITLIILPLLLNCFIFENDYVTKVSNDGWASFFGSYIGGAIGGIGTLIAMYVSVEQTKKQINETDLKDKRKERITEAEKIAELIASYISAINIYCSKVQLNINEVTSLREKLMYYKNLLSIWKEVYSNRYFNNYRDYIDKLNGENINSDYAKKFFEKSVSIALTEKQEKNIYYEYEQSLENMINEYSNSIKMKYALIEEYKQKNILGNNEFLLLDIKLKNVPKGTILWELINNLHNKVNSPFLDYAEIDKDIKNIKDYTRKFVNEYTL